MKKKKKILFVIDSLECAGAEKSLVTLLSLLDYSSYEADLMLFAHGGMLEELVPKNVNILKPLDYTNFGKLSLDKAIKHSIKELDFKMLTSRLKYSIKLRRRKYNNIQKARIYWESVNDCIENNPISYDIAISYAQGLPTFYVAEKVKAKQKFAWVNVSYRLDKKEKLFQQEYYDLYDKIVGVSESTKEIFLENYPFYRNKMQVIYDINNPQLISSMANIGYGFEDTFDGIRILTIGRFAKQKGYDIALEACRILKENNVNFRWYVLGKGPLELEIKDYIRKNNLTEHFILLGVRANPYPYIKNADIYVQTSKFEGFGIAIAEARMLNVPIVTTRFDSVFNQMIDGKNGLVVDMDSNSVNEGIMRLIKNIKLRQSIIEYLKVEKKDNLEEINKFYQLISGSELNNEEKTIIYGN